MLPFKEVGENLARFWSRATGPHLKNYFKFVYCSLTLFRMGGRRSKRPPTSFSPITTTNARISQQEFLTFGFNPFATLMQNMKAIPSASPKLLNLEQDNPSKKKRFVWSNPDETEFMRTSFLDMLELPNFGHMTTFTI